LIGSIFACYPRQNIKKVEGAGIMKIYHVCEYCQQVYSTAEVEGPEGAVQLNGTCEDCALELGMNETFNNMGQHFYN